MIVSNLNIYVRVHVRVCTYLTLSYAGKLVFIEQTNKGRTLWHCLAFLLYVSCVMSVKFIRYSFCRNEIMVGLGVHNVHSCQTGYPVYYPVKRIAIVRHETTLY